MVKLLNEYTMYHFISLDNANDQGFKAGLHDTRNPFKTPTSEYKAAFNKGHDSGKFIRRCVLGC